MGPYTRWLPQAHGGAWPDPPAGAAYAQSAESGGTIQPVAAMLASRSIRGPHRGAHTFGVPPRDQRPDRLVERLNQNNQTEAPRCNRVQDRLLVPHTLRGENREYDEFELDAFARLHGETRIIRQHCTGF